MCRNELRLEQLLADPMIRLMMSSDGVAETDIRQLARKTRNRRERPAAYKSTPSGAYGRSSGHDCACTL